MSRVDGTRIMAVDLQEKEQVVSSSIRISDYVLEFLEYTNTSNYIGNAIVIYSAMSMHYSITKKQYVVINAYLHPVGGVIVPRTVGEHEGGVRKPINLREVPGYTFKSDRDH